MMIENPRVIMSVKDVIKNYRDGDEITQALKGISFDVYEGELLCFLGESGCGKTTTLNIIGGMDNADGGSVKFAGNELIGASRKTLTEYRRKYVGFIFQSYNLMPNLTAIQNIDLIAEVAAKPLDSREVLRLVGLEDRANRYPSQLSGGQQQRVSIARALVKRPRLILADEPTAALDYATSIEVLTALENVVKSGTTIVMVTHNVEITKMANRILHFRNGNIAKIEVNEHPVNAVDLEW